MDEREEFIVKLKAAQSISETEVKKDYNAKLIRSKIDDPNKRNCIRDNEIFKDKKTVIDPYTGKMLHSNKDAAMAKYGYSKITEHIGQMDHTIPLQKVYQAAQYNPFLDQEAIKRIANVKGNYKFIDANLNQSKGGMSNLEYVKKNRSKISADQAINMLEADFNAKVAVTGTYLKETIQGMKKDGLQGAITAAEYGTVLSSLRHFKDVINDEEDLEDALINIIDDTGKAMIKGCSTSIITKTVSSTAIQVSNKVGNNTSKVFLDRIVKNGGISTIIVSAKNIGTSIVKYINNDINLDEMFLELGEKGTCFTTSLLLGGEGAFWGGLIGGVIGGIIFPIETGYQVGSFIGEFIGDLIGDMIGYSVGTKLFDKMSFLSFTDELAHDHYLKVKQEQEELRKILDQYQLEIEQQAKNLEIKGEILNECLNCLKQEDDSDFIYEALDTISILFGKTTNKMSEDEFYKMMIDDTKKFSL